MQPRLVRELSRALSTAQGQFAHDTLQLADEDLEELAGILVDFAVDVHNEIGIWTAYEQYNLQFFGSPLPLTPDETASGLSRGRIQHLLWMTYPQLLPGLVFSPVHQDLVRATDTAHAFLKKRIPSLPRDSGMKQFMQASNEFGWEVKRKLVWLGTRSYMFRLLFRDYMAEHATDAEDEDPKGIHTHMIGLTDDFICQETTCWSGLGCIDVLAGLLDLAEEQRQELRG